MMDELDTDRQKGTNRVAHEREDRLAGATAENFVAFDALIAEKEGEKEKVLNINEDRKTFT